MIPSSFKGICKKEKSVFAKKINKETSGLVKVESYKTKLAKTLGLSKSFDKKPFSLGVGNSEWRKYMAQCKPPKNKINFYDSKLIINLAKKKEQELSFNIGSQKKPNKTFSIPRKKNYLMAKSPTSKSQRKLLKTQVEAKKALNSFLENLNTNLLNTFKTSLKRRNQVKSRRASRKTSRPHSKILKTVGNMKSLNKSVKFLLQKVGKSGTSHDLKSRFKKQFKKNEKSLQSLNLKENFKRRGSIRQGLIANVSNKSFKANLRNDLQNLKFGVDLSTKNIMIKRQKKNYIKG